MNRIDRLSAILNQLQSSPFVKPKQIAERFSISLRTVYRDIKALEESGIPISGDSRVGYSLVEGFKLPPLMFTQEEAFAFLAAEKLVDKFTDFGLRESYKAGMDKIKAVMKMVEKQVASSISDSVGMLNFHATSVSDSNTFLHSLMKAIVNRQKVKLRYYSHNQNSITERIIDPVGLFFSMASWYCIGYCNEKKDYRTFRVSRIQHLEQTGIPVNKTHPSLDTLLNKISSQPDLKEVIIEVNKDKLHIIGESKYYQGLVMEKQNEKTVELHFMVFSLEHFARWFLSYIDIAKICSPLLLRDKVQFIQDNAATYR